MKKVEKTLWDHPFFDYARKRGDTLTEAEVENVLRDGYPSFEEMIQAAKLRFADRDVSWKIFDDAIAARAHRSMPETMARWLSSHRRLALAVLVIVLLFTFFTLAPTGRALAEKFFDIVMQVIGTQVELISQTSTVEEHEYISDDLETLNLDSYNKADYDDTAFGYEKFTDVQEFVQKTGLVPLALENNFLTMGTIYSYSFEPDAIFCMIEYTSPNGLMVTTTEQWQNKSNRVYELKEATYFRDTVFQNKEIIYAVSPTDGSFVGTVLLADSVFIIAAEKGVDIQELLAMLREYKAPQ